jgi:hypothetical protein
VLKFEPHLKLPVRTENRGRVIAPFRISSPVIPHLLERWKVTVVNKEAFEAALADINREIERLQVLKLGMEQHLGITDAGVSVIASEHNGTIPAAPYQKMNIPNALKAYLMTKRVPQTPAMIADGIRAGGQPTKSKNLAANIRTLMMRTLHKDPEIVRTRNGRLMYKPLPPSAIQ